MTSGAVWHNSRAFPESLLEAPMSALSPAIHKHTWKSGGCQMRVTAWSSNFCF